MRKMGPLSADHPAVADKVKCHGCFQYFKEGDNVTLISIGPGDNSEERAKARDGRPYNAVATIVHWACATGEE